MKKILVVALALVVALSLVSCSKSKEDEKYVLRMGIVSSAGHIHNQAITTWAEQVKADTDGRLEVVLLDSGQLGGERDYIEGLQLGNVDMAQVSSAIINGFVPDFSIMSFPYLFDSYESLGKIVTGEIGTNLFAQLESLDIIGLTWFSNGFRSIFTTVKDVQTPEDLAGVKIRVMESSVMIDSLNAMGASATPMAYSELYTAIQQGLLDGGENAPGNILSDKFYEVADQIVMTEHFATPGVVAISKKSMDKLPEDLQDYLRKAALELGEMERSLDKENQAKAIEQLEANGSTIVTVDKNLFKAKALEMYPKFATSVSAEIKALMAEELGVSLN